MIQFIKNLFSSNAGRALEVSEQPDILQYDDDGAARQRKVERLETRITDLRQKLESLETIEEDYEEQIRQLKRDHADEVLEATADLRESLKDLEEQLEEKTKELARLESDKDISTKEIEHMVRLAEERKELELEREKMEAKQEAADEVRKVRDEYNEKLNKLLETQIEQGEKRFAEILSRLPDVNARLKADISG